MTNWASRRRARGVRAALAWVAWDTKTSWLERFLRQLHSTSGGLHPSTGQTDSSQRLDQRAWASHLGTTSSDREPQSGWSRAAAPSLPGASFQERKDLPGDE